MPKNVGFRVLGTYFGSARSVTGEVRVNVNKEKPTVYDVMVEVRKLANKKKVNGVRGFAFDPPVVTTSSGVSLNSFTVDYEKAPKAGLDSGIYFLDESVGGNPVHVFQYYIFDKDGKQKNNNGLTRFFNEAPDDDIEDDDVIVWRQVAILEASNGNRFVAAKMKSAMDPTS